MKLWGADSAGNVYGALNSGTILELPQGTSSLTTLATSSNLSADGVSDMVVMPDGTLYVSSDGSLTGATALGSPVEKNLSLKAGQSKPLSLKVSSFPSVSAGTYQIIAQLTDSAGNTATATGPSLTIAPAFVQTMLSNLQPTPSSIAPGKKENLSFVLTNNGNTAAKGTASLAISLATTAGGAAQSAATVPLRVNLKPGAHKAYKVKFAVSDALAAGAYYPAVALDVSSLGDTTAADGEASSSTPFQVT